jgi:hypothetical protein
VPILLPIIIIFPDPAAAGLVTGLIGTGFAVGDFVGDIMTGLAVGFFVGDMVTGFAVGDFVGGLGDMVTGFAVGDFVGDFVGRLQHCSFIVGLATWSLTNRAQLESFHCPI